MFEIARKDNKVIQNHHKQIYDKTSDEGESIPDWGLCLVLCSSCKRESNKKLSSVLYIVTDKTSAVNYII